jgi:hypothetical protein
MHGFTAMMNYDDRFDFPKFELPNVWLSLTNGATGAFRSGGKMKLPPGHSLAGKFPEKVATKAEMEERSAKAKGEKVAGGGTASVDKKALDGISLDQRDRSAIDEALKTGRFDARAVTALENIDVDVIDSARSGIRKSGGTPRIGNEILRRSSRIFEESREEIDLLRRSTGEQKTLIANELKDKYQKKIERLSSNAKLVGTQVGALEANQIKASGKSSEYFRNASQFYQNEVPKIMQAQRDSLFREIDGLAGTPAPKAPKAAKASTPRKSKVGAVNTETDALDELLGF